MSASEGGQRVLASNVNVIVGVMFALRDPAILGVRLD
jgi:hypothetical protein